jgi:hypothetical protein
MSMNEPQVTGFYLKVYPPRWSDSFLEVLSAWGRKVYDHAPKLGAWMDDLASAEQLRRLKENSANPVEVTPVVLPAASWTNDELGRALVAVNALSYSTSHHAVGRFFDELVQAINAITIARLTKGTR